MEVSAVTALYTVPEPLVTQGVRMVQILEDVPLVVVRTLPVVLLSIDPT